MLSIILPQRDVFTSEAVLWDGSTACLTVQGVQIFDTQVKRFSSGLSKRCSSEDICHCKTLSHKLWLILLSKTQVEGMVEGCLAKKYSPPTMNKVNFTKLFFHINKQVTLFSKLAHYKTCLSVMFL